MHSYEAIDQMIQETEAAIRMHQSALAVLKNRLALFQTVRQVWPKAVADAAERIANGKEE
jgi:hypothetical protein